MLIPVRCFTCNKVIGHLWNRYCELVNEKLENGEHDFNVRKIVLDELGIELYCCRRMFLGHIDIIDNLLLYPNNPGETTTRIYNALPDNEEEVFQENFTKDDEEDNDEEIEEENEEDNDEEIDYEDSTEEKDMNYESE
jgi:DNA-directed RNA polymerase subunit N (RpoN/RPB10)